MAGATGEARMSATDLCYTPASELGRLIRARKLSPLLGGRPLLGDG